MRKIKGETCMRLEWYALNNYPILKKSREWAVIQAATHWKMDRRLAPQETLHWLHYILTHASQSETSDIIPQRKASRFCIYSLLAFMHTFKSSLNFPRTSCLIIKTRSAIGTLKFIKIIWDDSSSSSSSFLTFTEKSIILSAQGKH